MEFKVFWRAENGKDFEIKEVGSHGVAEEEESAGRPTGLRCRRRNMDRAQIHYCSNGDGFWHEPDG